MLLIAVVLLLVVLLVLVPEESVSEESEVGSSELEEADLFWLVVGIDVFFAICRIVFLNGIDMCLLVVIILNLVVNFD